MEAVYLLEVVVSSQKASDGLQGRGHTAEVVGHAAVEGHANADVGTHPDDKDSLQTDRGQ